MIALDLCQPHYQSLLIIYLKFIAKNVEIKTINLSVSLKSLKITNFLITAKSVEKKLKPMNGLIKKFPNTYKFRNNDINKFILLLRKGAYPYEYMDSWERFNEVTLLNKNAFYSKLYLENITDEDIYMLKKYLKSLNLKNLDEYHDLYVQGDTLLLADVFENFRNKCVEICELDPDHFCLNLD